MALTTYHDDSMKRKREKKREEEWEKKLYEYLFYKYLEEIGRKFEERALKEIGGEEILLLVKRGRRAVRALNDLYILRLLEYIRRDSWDYTPVAEIEFLIGYVSNRYSLRDKVRDFMRKWEE